jgi:hypothetical protein
MARPVVLVFQEFATVTAVSDIPDLNALLVGPAYHIQDFADDKGNIQTASNYGTLNTNNPYVPPLTGFDAITVADPPNNLPGALLDAASVKVFFDEARVLMVQDADVTDVSTGVSVTANSNVITATGGTPINFITSKVQSGDYIIIQDPAGGGTNLVKRVLAVDSATVIRATTNFDTTLTTLLIRIERQVSNIQIDSSFIAISGNQVIIKGGVTTILTGEVTPRVVNFAKAYLEYRSLRQDLRKLDTVSSQTEIETKIGKIDSRNPLAGTAFAGLQNTTTAMQFFGVGADSLSGHVEAQDVLETRKDVYAVVPLTIDVSIIASWNTQCTQLASVVNAETTGQPQKFRVVIGAHDLPTQKTISGPFTNGTQLSVTGAIAGTPIVAADAVDIFIDLVVDFVVSDVRAGDTLVIATDTAATTRVGTYTVDRVYDSNRLRLTTALPGVGPQSGLVQYYIIRNTGLPELVLPAVSSAGSSTATATITTNIDRSAGVANEYAGKVFHAGGTLSGDFLITLSTAANPAVFTVVPATVTTNASGVTGTIVTTVISVVTAHTASSRRAFRRLQDNTAAFISTLTIAGDFVEIPIPVTATNNNFAAGISSHVIAFIPLENEVILALGEDMPSFSPVSGDTTLDYRIRRQLTKDDQIDALVSVAQSFSSRRTILVWPDSVDVAGLVDGSKPRTIATEAELAGSQPGFYLSAVVGGLTAGLPSHQGFTNLGIAGISKIHNSNGYFSDKQLTELSDGGWFVFAQETDDSLPFSIHQLTTDPTTLESGEYSLVKNFDFISLYFSDIVDDFLGVYNITNETLGFMRQAVETGIETLKLRRFVKIGAPLTDASITSLEKSTASADRVELFMDVEMPKPLNVIGLHLVSV